MILIQDGQPLTRSVDGSMHRSTVPELVAEVERLRHGPANPTPEPCPLTRRQREIVLLMVDGHANDEISRRLGISVKTVKGHRTHIYKALKMEGPALVTRYAIRQGWVTP